MFFRSQALEEAHQELKDREQVLRSLSNAMAEERADERQKIAAYLHDDLAQVLFRLSIQVDVARKLLDKGDVVETGDQLEKIRESKQDTSDRIRALIRDLHRSPLGAKGLAEALESFTDEVGRDSACTSIWTCGRGDAGPDRAAHLSHRSRGADERAEACASRRLLDHRSGRRRVPRAPAPGQRRRASTRRCPGPKGTSA